MIDPFTIMAITQGLMGIGQGIKGMQQKKQGEALIQDHVNVLKNYNPDISGYDSSVNLYQNQVGQGSMPYAYQDQLNRVQGNLSQYLNTSLAKGGGTSSNAMALTNMNDELSKIAVNRQSSLEKAVDKLSSSLISRNDKKQEIYDVRNLESSKIENYGIGADKVRTGSENMNNGLNAILGAGTSMANAYANKDLINALKGVGTTAKQYSNVIPSDAYPNAPTSSNAMLSNAYPNAPTSSNGVGDYGGLTSSNPMDIINSPIFAQLIQSLSPLLKR